MKNKKNIFLNNRLIFKHGGPEGGPKPTAELNELSKRIEHGIKVSEADFDQAVERGNDIARKIDDLAEREAAYSKIKGAEKQLRQAINAADRGLTGDVARASTDELVALNEGLDAEEVQLLTSVQEGAVKTEAHLSYALSAAENMKNVDPELTEDINKMVKSLQDYNFTTDARGLELKTWAHSTDKFLSSLNEGGSTYVDAFMRHGARIDAREAHKTVKEFANKLVKEATLKGFRDKKIGDAIEGNKDLIAEMESAAEQIGNMQEPAPGASLGEWQAYAHQVNTFGDMLGEQFAGRVKGINAIQEDLNRQEEAHEKLVVKINDYREKVESEITWIFGEKNVSRVIKEGAEKALASIKAVEDGLKAPIEGETDIADYRYAILKVEAAYNELQGIKLKQDVYDAGGGFDLLEVAEVADSYKTPSEFREAYDAALQKALDALVWTKYDKSNFQNEAKIAALKTKAEELRNNLIGKLYIREGGRLVAKAKDAISSAVNGVPDAIHNALASASKLFIEKGKKIAEAASQAQQPEEGIEVTDEAQQLQDGIEVTGKKIDAAFDKVITKGPAGRKALQALKKLKEGFEAGGGPASINVAKAMSYEVDTIMSEYGEKLDRYNRDLANKGKQLVQVADGKWKVKRKPGARTKSGPKEVPKEVTVSLGKKPMRPVPKYNIDTGEVEDDIVDTMLADNQDGGL
ncbi:MAG: hypothetical protein O3B47_03965 [bacterium]|nr:hypothetical protein [bacterium]